MEAGNRAIGLGRATLGAAEFEEVEEVEEEEEEEEDEGVVAVAAAVAAAVAGFQTVATSFPSGIKSYSLTRCGALSQPPRPRLLSPRCLLPP